MKFTISTFFTDSDGLGVELSKVGVEHLAYEIEEKLEGSLHVLHGVNVMLTGVEVEPQCEGT